MSKLVFFFTCCDMEYFLFNHGIFEKFYFANHKKLFSFYTDIHAIKKTSESLTVHNIHVMKSIHTHVQLT